MPPRQVLDASAVLALLFGEVGREVVEPLLEEAAISTVNWSEILQKSIARGVTVEGLLEDFLALGVEVIDFGVADAAEAARLWPQTRSLGLSLGDRACIALGSRLLLPIVTADRAWATLSLTVPVHVVR